MAAHYTKPASTEFAGRVIYLPEGVQSSGYWSAEKLRRFLPDVVPPSRPLSRIFNRSTHMFDTFEELECAIDGNFPRLEAHPSKLPTGASTESLSSDNLSGQQMRSKPYGSSLCSSLNILSPLDTSLKPPQRKFSPNAIAIRASPRRRKRTHERKPTVAIKVADFAAKASPPPCHETGALEDSIEGQTSEDSMNELILECPTSPLRTELETRRTFGGITDYGNGPPGTARKSLLKSSTHPVLSLPIPHSKSPQTNRPTPDGILVGENIRTSDSPIPSPREKEFQLFSSSPTILGFSTNPIQNLANQNQEIPNTERVTAVSTEQALRKIKPNEYDDISVQLTTLKNPYVAKSLGGINHGGSSAFGEAESTVRKGPRAGG